jgi:hypothetical protein
MRALQPAEPAGGDRAGQGGQQSAVLEHVHHGAVQPQRDPQSGQRGSDAVAGAAEADQADRVDGALDLHRGAVFAGVRRARRLGACGACLARGRQGAQLPGR